MSDPSRDHIKAILTSTLDGPETDAQRTERLATTLHALFPAPRVVTTVDVLLAHAVQTNSHGFTTGCRCGFKAHSYLRYAQHIAALLTPAPEREPVEQVEWRCDNCNLPFRHGDHYCHGRTVGMEKAARIAEGKS